MRVEKPISKLNLMYRFSKITLLFFFSTSLFGQNCNYFLKGKVIDELTGSSLAFTSIFIEETKQGFLTNENGEFELKNICTNEIHLRLSHVSCQTERFFIDLAQISKQDFTLHHHNELLNEIQVHGSATEKTTQTTASISANDINKNANQNLADLLAKLTGVSTLKNGSGISKPIIQGLFGNRISILNNGVVQSGQQWGVDHAPEIDPFFADHISVIKGVSALMYGGNSLGGVVLVDSKPINNEPHLHGKVNYVFNSNGKGHVVNSKIEKSGDFINYRISGTFKQAGDTKTPNYFLTNTGKKEVNAAIQLEKTLKQNWKTALYYSIFNTEIGILRGSHIGNLSDLTTAFTQKIPFFTASDFSYAINAPKQKVTHQLLKLTANKALNKSLNLNLTYGGQINNRKEFDVRRGSRSEIPALSLTQFNHFIESKLIKDFENGNSLSSGFQYTFINNTNIPETGILPLIPDYISFQSSVFSIYKIKKDVWLHEIGGRFDYKQLNTVLITRTLPREIKRNKQSFSYFGFSYGSTFQPSNNLSFSGNVGLAMRPPEVNELYSFGLHQGVSSIEEGNENLTNEKSLKSSLSINYINKKWLFLEITPYFQFMQNYIYLQPKKEFLLTIRGAFPYFVYEQTDGIIHGLDALLSIEPTENIKWINKLSYVKGKDVTNEIPLVYIPPLNVSSSFQIGLPDLYKMNKNRFELECNFTGMQRNLLPEQDFLPPPPSYYLLNLEIETSVPFSKSFLNLSLKASNLLNTTYRNYLNRLRYFSEDNGRDFRIAANFNF